MPAIEADQSFVNLAAFKDALREWAIERNWTPHILDSDSHRVRAGCRSSPNCPFRIRANYSAKRGDARVTTVDDIHNCEPFTREGPSHQNIKRAETGKLKFLVEAVPKLMNVTVETSIHDIITTVERKYGQKIPTRQAQKVKGHLVTRVKGPCRHCHRMGHTRRHCPQLRNSAPGPINFSNNDGIDFSRNSHGDGDYADGGLADTFDEGDTVDYDNEPPRQANMFHQHSRPHPSSPLNHVNENGIDPSLGVAVDRSYGTTPVPPRLAPIQPPLSASQIALQQAHQNSVPRNHSIPRSNAAQLNREVTQDSASAELPPNPNLTPAEARREALRLMQQASVLMQQASKMQAEASRLMLSIPDTT